MIGVQTLVALRGRREAFCGGLGLHAKDPFILLKLLKIVSGGAYLLASL
jgi:hypothetical protein